jgi:hypothetical protein
MSMTKSLLRWPTLGVLGLAALAVPAEADTASYRFEWQGSGGYVMRGAMAFPAELLSVSRVIETDLTCFEVAGFQGAQPLGRWALGMLTPETTWTLTPDFPSSGVI